MHGINSCKIVSGPLGFKPQTFGFHAGATRV